MFNITAKGNIRCNGLIPNNSGGMTKRGVHMNSTTMSPNRGHNITDTKLKFSDRLKAYLSNDEFRSNVADLDDPYTFSDVEAVNGGGGARKCSRTDIRKVNSVNHVDVNVKSELNSGKTMSRLQAQIARNKVTVKHNRNDIDVKFDRNHLEKSTKHSIIGLINSVHNPCTTPTRRLPSGKPLPSHLRARRASRSQRTQLAEAPPQYSTSLTVPTYRTPALDVDSDDDSNCVFQRHWFSKELELSTVEDSSREVRMELTRTELKRQLFQMRRSRVGLRTIQPSTNSAATIQTLVTDVTQSIVNARRRRPRIPTTGLVARRPCAKDQCKRPALPCTRYCTLHIMDNTEQLLFEHCTAKFADNTQCAVPVFDIAHELPLCIEHARKRDNYNRMCQETKPKKPRRKIKPSAMIRPQKRNKKRKKPQKITDLPHTQPSMIVGVGSEVTELNVCETSSAYESSEDVTLGTLSESEFGTNKTEDHIGDHDVVEQVLAMQDEVGGDLELVVEQTLVTQASKLLEETDFTNVLNQIPADEFNDLFTVDRNGEYEPSREETEELERALEAVDEDVKSLEKLSQTQGLLDSLLDEHTLVESLVQIPDVFHHNGYEVQCVESQVSSRNPFHTALHAVEGMLPVQTHANAPS